MLPIQLVRKDPENIALALGSRGFLFDLERYVFLEQKRKTLQTDLENARASLNQVSQKIGIAKKQGQDVQSLLETASGLPDVISDLEAQLQQIQDELDQFLNAVPNLPHDSVPYGKNELDNIVIKEVGQPVSSEFLQDHVALCSHAMSFDQGAKLSGARFVVLHGGLARLNRALIQWMLDTHIAHGYHEVNVPYLVRPESLYGTAQLPKFAEEQYHLPLDNLYLIPTAEVSVTNIYAGHQWSWEDLPKKYVAYSACFRREAGSYGRDTRGLMRQHQFEKVELVQWVHPDVALDAHEGLTADAERLLEALELPYRRVLLCRGDMGFASCKTYDLEVWVPSQNCYREISSCSWFGDFQARRMKTRFKNAQGQSEYVHTLNGSGLAVGRTLLAIVENFQQENGDVCIPAVLQPYMGGRSRLYKHELSG